MTSLFLTTSFSELVTELMTEWKVPGASLAVADGPDTRTKAFGLSNLDGSVVTERTLFHTGSMSKSFTAGAVALLVDDDENFPRVKWDTPLSSLLPGDFVLSDEHYTNSMTALDILSHRSGLAGHEESQAAADSQHAPTPKSVTRNLRHLPCSKPIRAAYQYSNLMYIAASHLVESLTGKSFADFLAERFWRPLKMLHTIPGIPNGETLLASRESDGDAVIATPYYWDARKAEYAKLMTYNSPYALAAGNIISNTVDWTKWMRSMMNGSSGISYKSISELTKPQILVSEPTDHGTLRSPDFYGMGWHIHYYRGYKVISHAGGVPGHISFMICVPSRQWGFVAFGNADGMATINWVLGWTLVDELLEVPMEQRMDWAQRSREKRPVDHNIKSNDLDDGRVTNTSSLDLSQYTGRYWHPAYHELSVIIKDSYLFIHASDRMFPYTLTLSHVSGDDFLAEQVYEPRFTDYVQHRHVTFRVDRFGAAVEMGIDFMNSNNTDSYIWFARSP